MRQKWCRTCKQWFPTSDGCGCGYRGEKFNKYLRTAMLNNHLYGVSERVSKERTDQAHFVKAAKLEQKRVAGT